MKIHSLKNENNLKNLSYIIEYGDNNAICIDPYFPEIIFDFLNEKNLKLVAIINTHEHFDHIFGNDTLKRNTGCEIWNYKSITKDTDRIFEEHDKIHLDDNSYIEFIHTPGHTMNHICLKCIENNKIIGIITGDTLFNGGVGNCYGGDPEILYETIKKYFYDLTSDVKIYPGHDYLENNCKFTLSIDPDNIIAKDILKNPEKYKLTDIAIEKKINLFLQLDRVELRKRLKLNINTSEKELFLKLRELKNSW